MGGILMALIFSFLISKMGKVMPTFYKVLLFDKGS